MISTRYLLLVSAGTVYLVGTAEFMLSAILSPLAVVFDVHPEQITWLISAYALAYTLTAPIVGYLSDRIDKRKIVLTALLLLSFDSLAIILAPNLLTAVILRIFGGLASAALVPIIFALIADVVSEKKQVGMIGNIMMGMTVGIVTGPIIAGVLVQYFAWYAPFIYTAIGCALLFILALFFLPSTPIITTKKWSFTIIKQKHIGQLLMAKGIWNGVSVSIFLLAGEVLRQRIQLNNVEIGSLMGLFGVGLLCGNGVVAKIEGIKVTNNIKLVVIILIITGTIILFLSGQLSLLGHSLCLMALGVMLGIVSPISTAMLAGQSAENKGFILAISESMNNLVLLTLLPIFSFLFANNNFFTALSMVIVLMGMAIFGVVSKGTRPKRI